MPRRRQLVIAVAVAALAAVVGCDVPGAPPGGTNIDLRGKTVEVAGTWSGTEQENFQAVLNEFARRTGARVKYTSGGNDLPVLLNSRLAGGAPPDVAFIPQPGVVAELARRGVLKEIKGDAAATVRSNFSLAWQSLGTVDGRLYGIYFKVANKSVIWYRLDKFAEAGVQPPKTWDELTNVSQTLAEAGITPMVAAGGDGWVLTDWFENAYLRIGGTENYDKLAKHEIPWTHPSVVQTLQLLADYWRTPKFVQGGPKGAVQVTFTQSIADVFGERARTAMLFEGDFVASEIKELDRVPLGNGASFFEWPSINGSRPAVVAAGDQAVAFKDTRETEALMAFVASSDAARIMAGSGGFISANQNLDPSAYPDDTTRALAAPVVYAEDLRFDLSDLTPQAFGGGSNAHLWVLLQNFLSEPISAETMAAQLEDAANRDYGSN